MSGTLSGASMGASIKDLKNNNPTISNTSSVTATNDSIEDLKDNGLMIEGPPRRLEKIYDYEAGGHHPVHLSDILHQRYKVIHKLGSGGYANVWLCRDVTSKRPRYVAIKVIIAEGSTKDCLELHVNRLIELGPDRDSMAENFCLPFDQFEINGPNGLHYVLVYPVLGPRVSSLINMGHLEDPGKILRSICLQMTQAMAALHVHGICHGGTSFSPLPIRNAFNRFVTRFQATQYSRPDL